MAADKPQPAASVSVSTTSDNSGLGPDEDVKCLANELQRNSQTLQEDESSEQTPFTETNKDT